MKILHIHMSLTGGGVEAMICGLANEMAKYEDVSVCSIFAPKDAYSLYNKFSSNVKIKTCGKETPGFSIKELFSIMTLIHKGKYDVVHMHGFLYYYILSICFSLFSKTKFFYTVHSDAERENFGWDLKLLPIKKFFFRHKIIYPITISDNSHASFSNLYGSESRTIYNGIPEPKITRGSKSSIELYKQTPNTRVFIHAGRIDVPKNQVVLCQVFQRLIDEGNDVVLLIAGPIEIQRCYDSIKGYFSDRIIYLGERRDIPQLLSECEAMCLPSIWEGLPIVMLEALSVGCIPLCSNVGGIPNVISDGINGLLSESPQRDDYYKTIKKFLLMDSNALSKMKKEAQLSFKHYSIEQTTANYLSYYREMIANKSIV